MANPAITPYTMRLLLHQAEEWLDAGDTEGVKVRLRALQNLIRTYDPNWKEEETQ
tara:strand:- start:315 stop:479 length:165 start_codon:yes stop_codon:yes gene_type:complete